MNYVQIYIENELLDGVEDIDLGITYSIESIKDITKKTGYKTVTIKIPRTKNNERIFGIASDINVFSSENKNAAFTCSILENSSTVLMGYAYILSYKQTLIEIVCVANNASLKEILGESLLSDLKLNDLNHTWSDSKVFGSWTAGNDYIYPLIDYGLFRTRVADVTTTPFTELYPAVYVSRLLQQICDDAGILLNTNIFEVPYIQKLIMPFCNSEFNHTDDWVSYRKVHAFNANGAGQNYLASGVILFDTILKDDAGQFSLITDEYTPDEAQLVDVTFKFYVTADLQTPEVGLQYYDPNTLSWIDVPNSFMEVAASANQYIINITDIPLEVGFKLRAYTKIDVMGAVNILFADLIIEPQKKMYRSSTVDIATNVPKMKQIDFIKQLVQLFNLKLSFSDQTKTLTISTSQKFYTGAFVDWSDKLDLSEPPEISYVSDDVGSIFNFQYTKTETDKKIINYQKKFPDSIQFGNGQVLLNNDYNNETTDLADLKLRAVYSGKSYNSLIKYINLPCVYEKDLEVDTQETGTDPFFLIYFGNVDIGYLSDNSYSSMLASEISVSETEIPLCYFVKKEMSTGIDSFDVNLCFDMPQDEFNSTWNGRGLIDECYGDDIEMYNKYRKVVARFNLKDTDIESLDFSKYVWVEYFQTFFILSEINNYNPTTNETTEVTLIRVPR